MNISKNNNELTLTSIVSAGYLYVHAIIKIGVEEDEIIFDDITESESVYTLTQDGYFNVVEIKLPTSSGVGYYILGDVIYDPLDQPMTVAELLATDVTVTNIERDDNDLISTYFLNDYYIKLIKAKFLKDICNCACLDKSSKLMIDTLTMGLTLISKLEENMLFNEANRIINQLSVCTNITPNSDCNCYG